MAGIVQYIGVLNGDNMKNILNIIRILKVIILTLIIYSFLACSNNYHIDNAPKPKSPIADYENLFSKKEYNHLLQIIKEIKLKFDVEIHILTIKSINNHSLHVFFEKVDALWGHQRNSNKRVMDLTLSKNEKIFSFGANDESEKLINREEMKKEELFMRKHYFKKHEYYEGLCFFLDEIIGELQRNSKVQML